MTLHEYGIALPVQTGPLTVGNVSLDYNFLKYNIRVNLLFTKFIDKIML